MGPYKCPECGVWWSGLEHRCQKPVLGKDTNPKPEVYPWVWPNATPLPWPNKPTVVWC